MTDLAGYGADTWCDSSGFQPGRRVTGPRLVAQALFRRWDTPQMVLGIGEDEESYGDGITSIIGRDGAERSVLTLPSILRTSALKDDRVADIKVDAFITRGTDGMVDVELIAHVLLHGSGETFDFTVTADAQAATLGEVTAT